MARGYAERAAENYAKGEHGELGPEHVPPPAPHSHRVKVRFASLLKKHTQCVRVCLCICLLTWPLS